jgi:hypothetical protein
MHCGAGFEAGVGAELMLRGASQVGARAVTGRGDHGRIAPGAPADLVLLDYGAMSDDVMPGITREIDVVMARATARHVRALVVNGASVVANGVLTRIDLPGVERELCAQAQRAAESYRSAQPLLATLQNTLRACYAQGLHRQPERPQSPELAASRARESGRRADR